MDQRPTSDGMPNATARLAYSVDEAAQQLSISRTEAFRLVHRGELHSLKIGKRRLVSHEAILRFIANAEATEQALHMPAMRRAAR